MITKEERLRKKREAEAIRRQKPEIKVRLLEAGKQWQKRNPDKLRAQLIKREYGLDWETYLEMYERQSGSCAICRTPIGLFRGDETALPVPHVDHCHSTEKVRGLLCPACNKGLGHFKDNATVLRLAIEYLENT